MEESTSVWRRPAIKVSHGATLNLSLMNSAATPPLTPALSELNIDEQDDDEPVIQLVDRLIQEAINKKVSDIHIEPFEKEVRVRYRIDGVMYSAFNPPKRVQAALISRIKIMANLNIAEKRMPQDGRIEIKVADKAIDIRVSVLPVSYGERVVMRLLDKSRTFAKLRDLGFSDRDYKVVERAIEKPNGIFYVSGPTGSGKTVRHRSRDFHFGRIQRGQRAIAKSEGGSDLRK